MKRCCECKQSKPLTDFHLSRNHPQGRAPRCKDCARAVAKAWQAANPERARQRSDEWREQNRERYRARIRRWKQAHPERVREYGRKAKAQHPEKIAARQAVMNALTTGKLLRPLLCEGCKLRRDVEAHHADYSRPLDVRWLCVTCHTEAHHLRPSCSSE